MCNYCKKHGNCHPALKKLDSTGVMNRFKNVSEKNIQSAVSLKKR